MPESCLLHTSRSCQVDTNDHPTGISRRTSYFFRLSGFHSKMFLMVQFCFRSVLSYISIYPWQLTRFLVFWGIRNLVQGSTILTLQKHWHCLYLSTSHVSPPSHWRPLLVQLDQVAAILNYNGHDDFWVSPVISVHIWGFSNQILKPQYVCVCVCVNVFVRLCTRVHLCVFVYVKA